MGIDDLLRWRNERGKRPQERVREIPDREEPAAPSEPVRVYEHAVPDTVTVKRLKEAAEHAYDGVLRIIGKRR